MFILTDKKKCTKCGERKSRDEFFKRTTGSKDGLEGACKECRRKEDRDFHAANLELSRERNRRDSRKWRKEHPDKVRAVNRRYQVANSKKVYGWNRKWLLAHPEKMRLYVHTRQSRKNENGGKVTSQEWNELKAKYGNVCIVPGCHRTDLTMDHVIPLALGGSNTIDNIQPLCSYHNKSKGTKVIDYR